MDYGCCHNNNTPSWMGWMMATGMGLPLIGNVLEAIIGRKEEPPATTNPASTVTAPPADNPETTRMKNESAAYRFNHNTENAGYQVTVTEGGKFKLTHGEEQLGEFDDINQVNGFVVGHRIAETENSPAPATPAPAETPETPEEEAPAPAPEGNPADAATPAEAAVPGGDGRGGGTTPEGETPAAAGTRRPSVVPTGWIRKDHFDSEGGTAFQNLQASDYREHFNDAADFTVEQIISQYHLNLNDEQKDQLKTQLITANPSVFAQNGKLNSRLQTSITDDINRANAILTRLDLPPNAQWVTDHIGGNVGETSITVNNPAVTSSLGAWGNRIWNITITINGNHYTTDVSDFTFNRNRQLSAVMSDELKQQAENQLIRITNQNIRINWG